MPVITLDDVLKALDKVFAPDLRVMVEGEDSIIIGTEAITHAGADFLLHNCILEKSYDDIRTPNICVEVVFKEEI